MRFIEEHERSPRAWYGGAIGKIGFDGDMNTGLTLRTIRVKDGVAEVRAGATLLIDSDPADEERETELKASALLDALRRGDGEILEGDPPARRAPVRTSARVLLLDFEDSFVHTLADYLRQTGAEVVTVRAAGAGAVDAIAAELEAFDPSLVVLSPGPGRPVDFDVVRGIDLALEHGAGVFGVCLGLQGIVERFGGELGVLSYPRHGKPTRVQVTGGRVFRGMPERFEAGLYHSLHAEAVPDELEVTATGEDGVVMAVEHRSLPIAAVQFHPESLMSLKGDVGLRLIENVLATLTAERPLAA
jgi:anthranilate synthase